VVNGRRPGSATSGFAGQMHGFFTMVGLLPGADAA